MTNYIEVEFAVLDDLSLADVGGGADVNGI